MAGQDPKGARSAPSSRETVLKMWVGTCRTGMGKENSLTELNTHPFSLASCWLCSLDYKQGWQKPKEGGQPKGKFIFQAVLDNIIGPTWTTKFMSLSLMIRPLLQQGSLEMWFIIASLTSLRCFCKILWSRCLQISESNGYSFLYLALPAILDNSK